MSDNKGPSGGLSARERLRAECEERGVAYPLAPQVWITCGWDVSSATNLTGTSFCASSVPCLVTLQRFAEATASVRNP